MALVPTDKIKAVLKTYEKLWTKVKNLIRSISNNSDNYDEEYMKIKFNSDDGLPLKKTLELHNMIIVVRAVFHEGSKH